MQKWYLSPVLGRPRLPERIRSRGFRCSAVRTQEVENQGMSENHPCPHEVTHVVFGTVPFWLGWLGFNGGSTFTINTLLTQPQPLRYHHSPAEAEAPLQIVTFSTLPVALNLSPQQHLSPEISSLEFPQGLFTLKSDRYKLSMLHPRAGRELSMPENWPPILLIGPLQTGGNFLLDQLPLEP